MNLSDKSLQKVSAASLLVAMGIIYGDIGTSPLYVFQSIIGDRPISEELVLGGISCVFWTLVFQTTIKYIWLTLKADNQGEGGIFSLYALVRRYGKNLVIPTILGATTLLADGIITPQKRRSVRWRSIRLFGISMTTPRAMCITVPDTASRRKRSRRYSRTRRIKTSAGRPVGPWYSETPARAGT